MIGEVLCFFSNLMDIIVFMASLGALTIVSLGEPLSESFYVLLCVCAWLWIIISPVNVFAFPLV